MKPMDETNSNITFRGGFVLEKGSSGDKCDGGEMGVAV